MRNRRPRTATRTITVNLPDPLGSALWDTLADRTSAELNGSGAPASRRLGMKGSDVTTFYGDPGPLQRYPVLGFAARNAFAPASASQSQALPSASAPTAPSDLRSLVFEAGL
jgi:hypothetical protein